MGAGPLGMVAGFVVTLALTAALEAIGLSALGQRNLGVALLVGFGLTMVVPALGDKVSGALAPSTRVGARLPKGGDGFAGGALMGAGLGLVWAPCAGRRAKCCWMDDPSRLNSPATMSAGTATWSCANIGSTGSSTWAAPGPVA